MYGTSCSFRSVYFVIIVICLVLQVNIVMANTPAGPVMIVCQEKNIINISDFGAKADSRENAVIAVQKAIMACREIENPQLVFPQGRYNFWPQDCIEKEYYESNTTDNNQKRLAILIDKIKNLTIDGSVSEFIFHDRMQSFTADSSKNVIIEDNQIAATVLGKNILLAGMNKKDVNLGSNQDLDSDLQLREA